VSFAYESPRFFLFAGEAVTSGFASFIFKKRENCLKKWYGLF